jgi:uncharacterized BrkB/YihY/UPF0761 family membrane protein
MDTYGSRYKRRWRKTVLITMGVFFLALAATYANAPTNAEAWWVNALLSSAISGALFGTLITLVIALVPSRHRKVDGMSG